MVMAWSWGLGGLLLLYLIHTVVIIFAGRLWQDGLGDN